MKTNYEYDVFMSFASADEEQVKPIWQELSLSMLRVFWSSEILKKSIGDSFFDVIQDALIKSQHFLLIATHNSMQSNWVRLEYQTFFNQCHIQAPKTRRLIVFPLNNFSIRKLPPFLQNLQISNLLSDILPLFGGTNINQLLDENRKLKKKLREHEDLLKNMKTNWNAEVHSLREQISKQNVEIEKSKKELVVLEMLKSKNNDLTKELSEIKRVAFSSLSPIAARLQEHINGLMQSTDEQVRQLALEASEILSNMQENNELSVKIHPSDIAKRLAIKLAILWKGRRYFSLFVNLFPESEWRVLLSAASLKEIDKISQLDKSEIEKLKYIIKGEQPITGTFIILAPSIHWEKDKKNKVTYHGKYIVFDMSNYQELEMMQT